ncbi:relaxase/mobilization nuclease domain-containing protein [Acinetobacter sp. YH01022]|uniref:relaxase/mobilization nuclease domain-containing protein n=1 Tax=Acinetobacter sp. YH01022 TaxID=2601036 RepID=UPI0015D45877|nr:relaxase/mobilization nuclease domain-containing protein [Acinetobacter sp. YH01022]
MIIKVIANTIGSSVEERVTGLSDYIHHPKQTRAHHLSEYIHQLHPGFDEDLLSEKCVYSNSRNFLDDDPYYQKIEMSQTASLNSRVIDPIVHMVGSFKKFEVPTTEQLEQQIDILAKHLGAEELQMQYAMHMDTDNVHFHLIVNKVHPFKKNKHNENKVIDLGDGWIYNAVHRAAAEIEAVQGWEPEPNPMFIYNHGTGQCEKNPDYIPQPDAEKIYSKIRDQEHRHQQKSRMSSEIESGKDSQCYIGHCINQVLKNAQNWQDWHKELAQHGILYEKKRNGSTFKIKTSEEQELTFKASLFCNKQATLKNLEKKWGDFTAKDSDIKTIPLIKLNETSRHSQSAETTVHSYHLFKNEDFLVKDFHDVYLKIKAEKDSISKNRKNEYQEIYFENEIYKHNKNHFLKNLKQQFPEQSSDAIFTLLHYQHYADQINSRALQRERYKAQHESLSLKTAQTLQESILFSSNFDSSKTTSYADFLKFFPPSHHLLMQQQFLFDQRQSKNFICQDNTKIENAKILFDQNEPIAIQNRYGILVFSNYSITRLQQCIKALDSDQKGTVRGSSEFKELFYIAFQHRAQNIEDINKERALPSFERLSQSNIESCFTELSKRFRSTHAPQSTAIIKTCLLLNCCGIEMKSLQSTLKNCVDQKKLPDLNGQDQDILMLRIQNLIYTQPKELNKQYFNSSEIEHCWQLYFSLQISPLKQPKEHKHNSQPISSSSTLESELVPNVEKKRTIRLPENLAESEFEQMLQYFEYSRRLKLQKKQEVERLNILEPSKKISIPPQQSQMTSLLRKEYVIEYKFGQKFYLDQKKVAFFETKNTSEITVVSHQHEHVRDALFLARAKFGVVLVSGTDEFKKQVQQIADSEDIKIEFETPPQQKVNASIENSPVGDSAAKNDRAEPKPPMKELSLEPKDPSILNKEDKADNFYKNQSVTSSRSRKESTPENSYDSGPSF